MCGRGYIFLQEYNMERNLNCLRCGARMESLGTEDIQLGHHSLLFGDLSNLLSGSLSVDIMVCQNCKKLEFFYSEEI